MVYTSRRSTCRAEEIPLHNENSYAHAWPLRIWFFCQQPALAGGATPIADSRDVVGRLDPALVKRFADLGVMYVRNYRKGVDLPWQEVFQTDEKADVERFCDNASITCEWYGDELRTHQLCQGVATHPRTGEVVWFNQAHLFHPSALDEEVRETMLELFGVEGLPRYACYGDGAPIADEDLAAVRDAYQAGMVDVAWEQVRCPRARQHARRARPAPVHAATAGPCRDDGLIPAELTFPEVSSARPQRP